MKRTHMSHLKEILIRLAELKEELDKIRWEIWEIGEDIPIEKSIAITRAIANLQIAINHLTGVI